jgi:hypothetical protein
MLMEAVDSLPDNDDPDDPDAGSGKQISLDDLVKPADWPEDKNWGTLSIDAFCTPPSARKVDASPSRPLFPPGGLMEQTNAPLQRGRQG